MATKKILDDLFLSVGGSDISEYIKSGTLNYAAEIHDVTAMGDGGKDKISGFTDWSIDLELYGLAALSAILFPLVGAASTSAILMRETSAAVGADNPDYGGAALVENFPPLGGSAGDPHVVSCTIQGTKILTRVEA